MSSWTIRDLAASSADVADLDVVRAVNAANVPEVGPLDDARLALFLTNAAQFRVVETAEGNGGAGHIEGIFVGLDQDIAYASPNFVWFAARYERFAYVDRIALQPALRGTGAAAALYDGFAAWARRQGHTVVCAEVNTVPANPRSLAFHQRRGFVVLDEVAPYGGDERVAMVAKSL